MAHLRNVTYLAEGEGQLGFFIALAINALVRCTSDGQGRPTLPAIAALTEELDSFHAWQETRPEIRAWRTRDPSAGRVANRHDMRVAYQHAQFVVDPNATVEENAAARLTHERQKDNNEQETKTKAAFKRALADIKAHLELPPTTKEGIRDRLTEMVLPAIQYIHKCFEHDPGPHHAGDRHTALQFFRGALLLNPSYAKNKMIDDLYQLADRFTASHPKLNTEQMRQGL